MRRISTRPAFWFFLCVTAWGMALPLSCLAEETSEALRFAVFPYKSPKSVIEMFEPIAARLEKKLGRKVQIVYTPGVQSFVERGKKGEYDIVWPSPVTYFKLNDGYTVIAKGMPAFYGGLIVRNDSEIHTLKQCRGKRLAAFGTSSSAYMLLMEMLKEKGITPHKDVDIEFLGKHDSVIYGVLNKKFDAGVIKLDTLDLPDLAPLKNQFRVVARSIAVPQFPFLVKNGMDQRTVAAIREVLTSLSPDKPEDLEILKGLQVEKIVGATSADYDQFYEVIKDTEYNKQRN